MKARGHGPGRPTQKTLYAQLLARSLFVLAALLLLIGSFQYFLMRGFLYQNQAETLEAQFRSIPPFLIESWRDGQGADAEAIEELSESAAGRGGKRDHRAFLLNGLSLAAIDREGQVTDLNAEYGTAAPVLAPAAYQSFQRKPVQPGRIDYRLADDANGTEQLLVLRPAGGFGGSGAPMLQIGMPTGPLTAILWRQLAIFAGLSMLALAGGFALYRPVLRRSLSPLSRMVAAVKQIDAGRLDERFPTSQGQAEVDHLALSFNGMLERLEEAFSAERELQARMRRFIADASHELRTPLTSIRGFLEVLLRGSRISEEQLRAALRSMHGESERMTKLVEDLLLLVKLDRGPELQLMRLRPAELLRELEAHLRMLAGDRTVTLDTKAGEAAEISGDSDKLKQIVLNLFGNAVQHTDPLQGAIALILDVSEGAARIAVRDNGPGIAPDLQRKVFERFYRGDDSRSRRSGGAGLGLSISLSIAEAHGGTLELDSSPGTGSTFRVVLPLE
ncbi:HAMP domain-containing sensor histidine kinase [Saccharibacillus qingshengii]|uniref:sensor histidine kinase n=1 Tax=Saccharibacillus qingshengii TaxID=1763540 RepID=UPI0031B5C920